MIFNVELERMLKKCKTLSRLYLTNSNLILRAKNSEFFNVYVLYFFKCFINSFLSFLSHFFLFSPLFCILLLGVVRKNV